MVVIGIMAVLMTLLVPSFTSLKSAGDVTNSAHTISGMLEQARNHAMANNTYVWVGFYEEDISAATPSAAPGNGRIVLSTVASLDGSTIYSSGTSAPIDPTRLKQVSKLIRIENAHLDILPDGSGTGGGFDGRPSPDSDPFNGSRAARFGNINTLPVANSAPNTNSQFPFQYPVGNPAPSARYTFQKTLQFSPRGEATINSTYGLKRVAEIGLRPTHGSAVDATTPNVAAIQFSGIGGNFKIYWR